MYFTVDSLCLVGQIVFTADSIARKSATWDYKSLHQEGSWAWKSGLCVDDNLKPSVSRSMAPGTVRGKGLGTELERE